MGTPNRIAIATHGYRCFGKPTKVAIATHGYRCLEPPSEDPFGGGMGHGAVIRERRREVETTETESLAILAVLAIQEFYDG